MKSGYTNNRWPELWMAILLLGLFACSHDKYSTWEAYHGSKSNLHYSSLKQIDTSNVGQLQVAWTYHSGDADTVNHSQIQCNPLIIDGVLYGTSPTLKLFALDAATGTEKWIFNPFESFRGSGYFFATNNCRGIATWSDGSTRYLYYTAGVSLFCIDAGSGKPVESFGDHGRIDLSKDLGRDVRNLFVTATSPGVVYKNLIIMGTRVDESAASAPGHIRAYDVKTGKLVWIFHTIPQPGEPGYETWSDPEAYRHIGGANAWSGLTLDEQRGIVYAATGSAAFDFYGGKRLGNDLYANCILALDAATGKKLWHYQTIHHDAWDRDLPAAPVLVTLHINGGTIDALAQTTKTGFIFVLDRETGRPIFPVKEQQVPTTSDATGESLSSTQPEPVMPDPFMPQTMSASDLNDIVPDTSQVELMQRFNSLNKGEMFTPLSTTPTLVFPGLDGGGEWGGPSVDPETGILYVNANIVPWVLTLSRNDTSIASNESMADAGKRLFVSNCATCHGWDRAGAGNAPSLLHVDQKYELQNFLELLTGGRRMMPGFGHLSDEDKHAIASYVLELDSLGKTAYQAAPEPDRAYRHLLYSVRVSKFLTKGGYPGIKPPWGTLNAIDLNSGKYIWKQTLGDYPEFKAHGIHTGTENYGGPVTTAGGLIFIAATRDGYFRAFRMRTGEMLWETSLPAPGFATPAVYEANGKQFVVIACGGGKLGTPSGDAYVAYSLKP